MSLSPTETLALGFDPSLILKAQGYTPDPWQRDFLLCPDREVLLNCCRQAGKSTVVAALAIHTALYQPGSLILLLSPSQRQSHELFRKMLDAYRCLGRPVPPIQDAQTLSKLELSNGSRLVGLPGKEATIRSFSKVKLLLIDEAARVNDDLYRSVRPMLSVSNGRLIALSTPFGQRGFFYDEWTRSERMRKFRISWRECPRISAAFIEGERESLGDHWVQQEFECAFGAMEGLVYPTFSDCLIDCYPAIKEGRMVGGIDFGWRNPFAAIWGIHDKDDVLWIAEERYLRQTPLHEHASALKKIKRCRWYCDPAGATEIAELRSAGIAAVRGINDLRAGIAAVTARIQTNRLKVCLTTCPNLIAEAKLYRYPSLTERANMGENPIDSDNHALAALRYLVSRLDTRFIASFRRKAPLEGVPEEDATLALEMAARSERVRETQRLVYGVDPDTWDDPDLWENL